MGETCVEVLGIWWQVKMFYIVDRSAIVFFLKCVKPLVWPLYSAAY